MRTGNAEGCPRLPSEPAAETRFRMAEGWDYKPAEAASDTNRWDPKLGCRHLLAASLLICLCLGLLKGFF